MKRLQSLLAAWKDRRVRAIIARMRGTWIP